MTVTTFAHSTTKGEKIMKATWNKKHCSTSDLGAHLKEESKRHMVLQLYIQKKAAGANLSSLLEGAVFKRALDRKQAATLYHRIHAGD